MTDTADWKAIALALGQRVNFAITHLKPAKGTGAILNTETLDIQGWHDYMVEALEMIPNVTVDREMLATLELPARERKKAQREIKERRK